jgi:hypothetical protein
MSYFKRDGEVVNVFTGTRVLSASATYSNGIHLERGEFFGLWLSAAPASCASGNGLTVWYELAPSDTAALYVCAGSVTTGVCALSGLASGFSLSPYPMPFARFGCSATSGGNTVSNSTSATAKLFIQ